MLDAVKTAESRTIRMHCLIEVGIVGNDFVMSVGILLMSGKTIARMPLAIGRAFDISGDGSSALCRSVVRSCFSALCVGWPFCLWFDLVRKDI